MVVPVAIGMDVAAQNCIAQSFYPGLYFTYFFIRIFKANLAVYRVNFYIFHSFFLQIFGNSQGAVATGHSLHLPVYLFHHAKLINVYRTPLSCAGAKIRYIFERWNLPIHLIKLRKQQNGC